MTVDTKTIGWGCLDGWFTDTKTCCKNMIYLSCFSPSFSEILSKDLGAITLREVFRLPLLMLNCADCACFVFLMNLLEACQKVKFSMFKEIDAY